MKKNHYFFALKIEYHAQYMEHLSYYNLLIVCSYSVSVGDYVINSSAVYINENNAILNRIIDLAFVCCHTKV